MASPTRSPPAPPRRVRVGPYSSVGCVSSRPRLGSSSAEFEPATGDPRSLGCRQAEPEAVSPPARAWGLRQSLSSSPRQATPVRRITPLGRNDLSEWTVIRRSDPRPEDSPLSEVPRARSASLGFVGPVPGTSLSVVGTPQLPGDNCSNPTEPEDGRLGGRPPFCDRATSLSAVHSGLVWGHSRP